MNSRLSHKMYIVYLARSLGGLLPELLQKQPKVQIFVPHVPSSLGLPLMITRQLPQLSALHSHIAVRTSPPWILCFNLKFPRKRLLISFWMILCHMAISNCKGVCVSCFSLYCKAGERGVDCKWTLRGQVILSAMSCGAVLCLVAQSSLTLCNLIDCGPPGSSVQGDSPGQNTEVGCHSLLQRIFPTQESNQCFLHCRQIPYP